MKTSDKNGNEISLPQISIAKLLPFTLITFGLAWGILGLYIFFPEQMSDLFGRLSGQHPLFYLSVYAPAIAACLIIVSVNGKSGLKQFLSRLKMWRCSFLWWGFLLIGIPVIFFAGAYLKGSLFSDPFPFSTINAAIIAVFLAIIKGPVEELGWRGFALPLLQRKMTPFWAAILLGIVWGVWHLPAFLLSGTQQSNWAFLPFLVGCVALSVIVTPLYNASGGSVLLAGIFHFMVMNPLFPDAQPYDTYILLGVALIIVLTNQQNMFSRNTAVTGIIPERGKIFSSTEIINS